MPNLKIRDFGGVGLVKDIPASDTPPQAWTTANNVRFTDKYAERSGVFKQFGLPLQVMEDVPLHISTFVLGSDDYDLIVVGQKATPWKWDSSTQELINVGVDVTTYPNYDNESIRDDHITGLMIGGGHVIVSGGAQPIGLRPDSDNYVPLMETSATWKDSTWKVAVVWKDRLIVANGVDATGAEYPYRIFWSGPCQTGSLPTDWAAELDTSTAGWVDMSGLDSEILDMAVLDDQLFIFSRNKIVRMWDSGGSEIFSSTLASSDDGVIATGCLGVIPHLGIFVVGSHSIYVYTGQQKQAIAYNRVEQWFRRVVDMSDTTRLKVLVDPSRTEAWIVYRSLDGDAHWQDTNFANQALVWNWSNAAWATRDLPNVAAMAATFYQTSSQTWEDIGLLGDTLTGTTFLYRYGFDAAYLAKLFSATRLWKGLWDPTEPDVPDLVGREFTLRRTLALPLVTRTFTSQALVDTYWNKGTTWINGEWDDVNNALRVETATGLYDGSCTRLTGLTVGQRYAIEVTLRPGSDPGRIMVGKANTDPAHADNDPETSNVINIGSLAAGETHMVFFTPTATSHTVGLTSDAVGPQTTSWDTFKYARHYSVSETVDYTLEITDMNPRNYNNPSGNELEFTPPLNTNDIAPGNYSRTYFVFDMLVSTDEQRALALTYEDIGGTYESAEGQNRYYTLVLSAPNATSTVFKEPLVLAYEDLGKGALVTDQTHNANLSTLEKVGEDGDSIGIPISAHQYLSEFVPQGSVTPGEVYKVSLGGSLYPDVGYKWTEPYPFTAGVDRWINGRVTGRYVGWRLEAEDFNQMRISGADIQLEALALR